MNMVAALVKEQSCNGRNGRVDRGEKKMSVKSSEGTRCQWIMKRFIAK